ncbi:MAG TPA: EamA family transporter [Sutterella sp.]|nr:EamA family transporter [Sutterella sp.]
MMSPIIKGSVLIIIASLLFSITGTLRVFAPEEASTFVITEMRVLIGFVCMFAWCAVTQKLPKRFDNIPWRFVALCVVGSIGYQFCFFSSMLFVGVAVGTVVAMGVTPCWSAVIAFVFKGIKPSSAWYIATGLSIAGVICLNLSEIDIENPIFLTLPVLAGLFSSFYIEGCSHLMRKLEPETAVLLIVTCISIVLSPVFFIFPVAWIATPSGLTVCLALGVLTCGFGFPVFMAGARYLRPPVVATINMIEPVCAASLGIFLLNEDATLLVITGIVLVCAGVLYLVLKEK